MNADELLQQVLASGADEAGIRDRFGDNSALYESCFLDFISEPSFDALRDAMDARDWPSAFQAAHALKGLSGNLGVTAFYQAIRVLVESLRHEEIETIWEEYAEVLRQHDRLRSLLEPQRPQPPAEPAGAAPLASTGSGEEISMHTDAEKTLRRLLLLGLAAVVVLTLLLIKINVSYHSNVVKESGQHLAEMSNQLRQFVEEHITNDWRIALSVGTSMADSGDADDDEILDMLEGKREVWGVSELVLSTDSGLCLYSDGHTVRSAIAADAVAKASAAGRNLTLLEESMLYTVPLETGLCYSGEKITAVSVVREMQGFLDDMELRSFHGSGWLYLTEQDGTTISTLSNPTVDDADSIFSLTAGMKIEPLEDGCTTGEYFTSSRAMAFLLTRGSDCYYGVSMPIAAEPEVLRAYYFVPEAVVNQTMNGFSRQLSVFSLLVIVLISLSVALVFFAMYRSRTLVFSKELLARERMFDLLTKNTKTAFALFSLNQPRPDFVSENTPEVIGDGFWMLDRTEHGYKVRNDRGTRSENIDRVNELLRQWDGQSIFRSGYLTNRQSGRPSRFAFEVSPVGTEGTDFIGIALNVTHVYEREEATKAALEMASRSNEAKTRFLSNMSHDIRTPMNAITNMTNFALESIDQPKKLKSFLHVIRDSSEHLLHLINDALDVSRIESGQSVVASTPFELCAEFQRQADIIRPLCEAKHQLLITNFSGLAGVTVRGDAMKLSQIVMNLLSNAVKFTPEKGAVRLSASLQPSLREEMVTVCFTVEDNGIGIASAEQAAIFEPFCRASSLQISQIEGTGLGLSICKSYVEAMGGSIHVSSELGEGSIFTVELFFQKADALPPTEPQKTVDNASFLGMRCLVAEDNRTNQMIADELLKRLGFLVDFADDGNQVVERFFVAKPGTYDVIYMDIQMPGLDGYQATVKIRNSDHPQAQTIPIVAMTANAFAEDIEKARVAGMDAYVEKPIRSFHLAEQTEVAIERKQNHFETI